MNSGTTTFFDSLEKKCLQIMAINERVEKSQAETNMSGTVKALSVGEESATQNEIIKDTTITTEESNSNDCPTIEEEGTLFSTASSLSEEMILPGLDNSNEVEDYFATLLAEIDKDPESAYAKDTDNAIQPKVDFSEWKYSKAIFEENSGVTYTQIIPDENDLHYFCRVCQKRSISRSAFYHHLTNDHSMILKPLEHWRSCDPEVIPTEFDDSLCCIICQKVFDKKASYRFHLGYVHNLKFPSLSKEEQKERQDAVFNSESNSLLQLAKILVDKKSHDYGCTQCTKRYIQLLSLVRHYFKAHNMIVEIQVLEDDNNRIKRRKKQDIKTKKDDDVNDKNKDGFLRQVKKLPRLASRPKNDNNDNIDEEIFSCDTNSQLEMRKRPDQKNYSDHPLRVQSISECPRRVISSNLTAHGSSKTPDLCDKPIFTLKEDDFLNSYCYMCRRAFSSPRNLTIHICGTTHQNFTLQCFHCELVFEKSSHVIRFHYIRPKNRSRRLQSYSGHYDTRQKNRRVLKTIENNTLKSTGDQSNVRSILNYSCEMCSEKFASLSILASHQFEIHKSFGRARPRIITAIDGSTIKESVVQNDDPIKDYTNKELTGEEYGYNDFIEDCSSRELTDVEYKNDDYSGGGDYDYTEDFTVLECNDVTKDDLHESDKENNAGRDNGRGFKAIKRSSPRKTKTDFISLSSFTEKLFYQPDLKCHTCQEEFESRYATLIHFVQFHQSQSLYSSEGTDSSSTCDEEISVEPKDSDVNFFDEHYCDQCSTSFIGEHICQVPTSFKSTTLDIKRAPRHNDLTVTILLYCLPCDKEFSCLQAISRHYAHDVHKRQQPNTTILNLPLQCMVCDERFSNKLDSIKHARSFHQIKQVWFEIVLKQNFYQYYTEDSLKSDMDDIDKFKSSDNSTEVQSLETEQQNTVVTKIIKKRRRRKTHYGGGRRNSKKARVARSKHLSMSNAENLTEKIDHGPTTTTATSNSKLLQNKLPTTATLEYECDICHLVISNRVMFRQHREKVHCISPIWDTNERYCNICQSYFETKQRYQIHSEDVHDLIPTTTK